MGPSHTADKWQCQAWNVHLSPPSDFSIMQLHGEGGVVDVVILRLDSHK